MDEELDQQRSTAAVLVDELAQLRYEPVGDTSHSWHMDWIDRAGLLSGHLGAVLELERTHLYPSALALVRVGLEHSLIDRLIVLAERWEQHIVVPDDQDPEGVRRRLEEQVAGGVLHEVRRADTRRFVVIRPGLRAEDDSEEWLSAYTFWDERFDPFRGRPDDQERLQGYFMDLEAHRQLAQESAELWHRAFSWKALRRNLELSHLLPAEQLFQLDVHYGFLSAFVHPTSAGYAEVLGHNRPRIHPHFNHYVSELLLLYVVRTTLLELRTVSEGMQRKPACRIGDGERLRKVMDDADENTKYAWFLGGNPTDYDRVATANLLEWRDKVRRDPSALTDDHIAYAENPLARLAHIHWSFQELTTGHVYASPWQRDDGWRYA